MAWNIPHPGSLYCSQSDPASPAWPVGLCPCGRCEQPGAKGSSGRPRDVWRTARSPAARILCSVSWGCAGRVTGHVLDKDHAARSPAGLATCRRTRVSLPARRAGEPAVDQDSGGARKRGGVHPSHWALLSLVRWSAARDYRGAKFARYPCLSLALFVSRRRHERPTPQVVNGAGAAAMIVRLRLVYGETKKIRHVRPLCQFPSTRRRGRERSLKGGGWGSPGRRPTERQQSLKDASRLR